MNGDDVRTVFSQVEEERELEACWSENSEVLAPNWRVHTFTASWDKNVTYICIYTRIKDIYIWQGIGMVNFTRNDAGCY